MISNFPPQPDRRVFVQVPTDTGKLARYVARVVSRNGSLYVKRSSFPADTSRTSVYEKTLQIVHSQDGCILTDLYLDVNHPNSDDVAERLEWAKQMGLEFFLIDALIGKKLLQEVALNQGSAQMVVQIPHGMNNKSCQGIYGRSLLYMVTHWATQAGTAGANIIACSPHVLQILRKQKNFDSLSIVAQDTCSKERSSTHRTCLSPQQAFDRGANHVIVDHD